VPVPIAEFPRVNTRDETRKIIDIIMAGDPDQAGDAADALFRAGS
jgi:DNA-binding FadR family transcriptional regulator